MLWGGSCTSSCLALNRSVYSCFSFSSSIPSIHPQIDSICGSREKERREAQRFGNYRVCCNGHALHAALLWKELCAVSVRPLTSCPLWQRNLATTDKWGLSSLIRTPLEQIEVPELRTSISGRLVVIHVWPACPTQPSKGQLHWPISWEPPASREGPALRTTTHI